MDFIRLENARLEDQREVMRQIQKDNVCPFCAEHLSKYHKKPIHAEGKYWVLTENQWPYDGAKNHLLAITKKHVRLLSELPSDAMAELFDLFNARAKELEIAGGTVAIRFGDTTKYASSVLHLHAHLIEPDVEDQNHPGIKFPISKPATPQK